MTYKYLLKIFLYYNYFVSTGPLNLDYDIKVDINLGPAPSKIIVILSHPLVIKGHYTKDSWKFDESTEIEYGPKKIQYKEYLNEDHTGIML